MQSAVLLADAIAWYDEDGERQEAEHRGTELELPAEVFERHAAAGNVATPGSKEAKSAASYDPDAGALSRNGTWGS